MVFQHFPLIFRNGNFLSGSRIRNLRLSVNHTSNIVFIIDDFPDHINRPLKVFRCRFPAIHFLAAAHRLKRCRNTFLIKNPTDFCFGITLICQFKYSPYYLCFIFHNLKFCLITWISSVTIWGRATAVFAQISSGADSSFHFH